MWWLAFGLGVMAYTFTKFVIFKPTILAQPEKAQIGDCSPVRNRPNCVQGNGNKDEISTAKKNL
jgi:hypothetical protein